MPIPEAVHTLERPILRETVYERLRDWIVQGVLEPAEQLRDQELASSLGVSRTPVREALRRLEDEGLVETAKNRWTRVSPLALSEARQIYPIVRVLEGLALELALPSLSKADLAAMQQANEALAQALEQQHPSRATEADLRFHQVFIDRSNSLELITMLTTLKHKYRRLERFYFGSASLGERSVKEHQQLLKALEKKDLTKAKTILEANWSIEWVRA